MQLSQQLLAIIPELHNLTALGRGVATTLTDVNWIARSWSATLGRALAYVNTHTYNYDSLRKQIGGHGVVIIAWVTKATYIPRTLRSYWYTQSVLPLLSAVVRHGILHCSCDKASSNISDVQLLHLRIPVKNPPSINIDFVTMLVATHWQYFTPSGTQRSDTPLYL